MASKSVVLYIPMDGIKYAWYAPSYGSIGAALGVKVAKPNEKGLIFGSNSPKPVLMRISFFKNGNKGETRSTTRFCDPKKVAAVLNGGLKGKKVKVGPKSFTISGVSVAG